MTEDEPINNAMGMIASPGAGCVTPCQGAHALLYLFLPRPALKSFLACRKCSVHSIHR